MLLLRNLLYVGHSPRVSDPNLPIMCLKFGIIIEYICTTTALISLVVGLFWLCFSVYMEG